MPGTEAKPQTFDFASHLYSETGINWEVLELIGGAANHTVRVRRFADSLVNDADEEERLVGDYHNVLTAHASVVLKQAPAYLAKSPQIPFSPYRQTIEAAALKLLHQSPEEHTFGFRHILRRNPLITIPKLLLHDHTHNILIQSDLGAHSNLYEVLISPDTSPLLASELGEAIGRFLANLHDAFIITSEANEASSDLVAAFANEDAERVMHSVIRQATSFMQDAEVSDFDALGKLAASHWSSRHKTAFSQGDLWFGTLLIRGLGHNQSLNAVDQLPAVTVGICDWEFAGPNHPAADIAQLGSYLHLLSLSPLNDPRRNDVLMAFSEALYGTYFSTTSVSDEYQRSLLILHGWEMINAAGWDSRQHMWCRCGGDGVRCSHIRSMVNEGALLLRAAVFDGRIDIQALKTSIPWAHFFE